MEPEEYQYLGDDIQHLPCRLTQEELLARGDQLARVQEEIRNEEDRANEIKQQLKATLTALEAKSSSLATIVRRRQEHRDVQCARFLVPERRVVRIIRNDTGEVVEERPATHAEMQRKLVEA